MGPSDPPSARAEFLTEHPDYAVKIASKLRPMEQDYAENLLKEIAQIKRNNEWNNMFKNAKCKFGEFIIL